MGDDREMVEAFFDQKTNDSIGVEDEIRSLGILVSNHAGSNESATLVSIAPDLEYPRQKSNQLGSLGQDMDVFLIDAF